MTVKWAPMNKERKLGIPQVNMQSQIVPDVPWKGILTGKTRRQTDKKMAGLTLVHPKALIQGIPDHQDKSE